MSEFVMPKSMPISTLFISYELFIEK